MMKPKAKNSVKWPQRNFFLALKKAENKCASINKKAKKKYFKEVTKNDQMTNKKFWRKIKPFLTSRGFSEHHIRIEIKDQLVTDEKILRNF